MNTHMHYVLQNNFQYFWPCTNPWSTKPDIHIISNSNEERVGDWRCKYNTCIAEMPTTEALNQIHPERPKVPTNLSGFKPTFPGTAERNYELGSFRKKYSIFYASLGNSTTNVLKRNYFNITFGKKWGSYSPRSPRSSAVPAFEVCISFKTRLKEVSFGKCLAT